MDDFLFDTIEAALEDIRNGKIVIVVDDEDRENEGDFVMAAELVTPAAVNLMATHGRGLICTPVTRDRAYELKLDRMVEHNTDAMETAFTVSVDARANTTTGISAADRANTETVPDYTLVDATLGYDLGQVGLDGVDTRLNVSNLLDEDYVASCNSLEYCYFGAERGITASVHYRF